MRSTCSSTSFAPARVAARGGQHAQVVAAAASRMEARLLEHGAHLGTRVLELLIAAPGKARLAGIRVDQAEEHPQGRALPGPVRPEEPGHTALLHLKRQVGDRAHGAEALGQSLYSTAATTRLGGEQRQVGLTVAAQLGRIHRDADDAARLGEHPGLRLDRLSGEDPSAP